MPLGVSVARSYLLSRTEVTSLVGTRISTRLPLETVSPRWPALRLTDLSSTEVIPRVWSRTLMQVDCWGTEEVATRQLGQVVAAALRASANFQVSGAVMGETDDLTVRYSPDTTLVPSQPRAIVVGHVWVRPSS